jgi:ABC-2 type transport system ATP-binding protein
MTDAIFIKSLSKNFEKKHFAIKNINLQVPAGTACGFIGKNGAGKSTTIKILTGAIRQTSGEARIYGVDTRDHSARKNISYVPESPCLYKDLTPYEIIEVGLALHKIKDKNRIDYWLNRFDLTSVAKKQLATFSKGMLQRTALAHALAIQPKLLILDEPLSGLDPIGRKDVVDILAEFNANGGTLFFSSHVLHDVERLADHFLLIHNGEIIENSTPKDIITKNQTLKIRSFGQKPINGMTHENGQRWSLEVDANELWKILAELEKEKHQIIEIKPAFNLENLFVTLTKNDS